MAELRRFLCDWIDRMRAIYVAVSLPPEWQYPDDGVAARVIDDAILPVCRERNLPFALMIGVTRQANPGLRMAGDALGRANLSSLHRLCANNPRNKVSPSPSPISTSVCSKPCKSICVSGWFVRRRRITMWSR